MYNIKWDVNIYSLNHVYAGMYDSLFFLTCHAL